jgi:hypothetical protein
MDKLLYVLLGVAVYIIIIDIIKIVITIYRKFKKNDDNK